MAFENARLTKEEIVEFEKKELKDPWLIDVNMRRLSICTIDRERDIFLLRRFQDREAPENYYFVLYWKGTILPIQLRAQWNTSKARVWELISIKIPSLLRGEKIEIIECLKEALIVYSYDGYPEGHFNGTIVIEFNFDLSRLEILGELK